MSLLDEIKPLVKREVLNDEQILETYSKDASIFQIKPELVVCPKDAEDIKNLVKYINEYTLSPLSKEELDKKVVQNGS